MMLTLDLEKAEEPEIKLPTSAGSSKKQESSRKTPTSVLLTMSKPLTVWTTTNYGKFLKRWEYQTTWPTSWERGEKGKRRVKKLAWSSTFRKLRSWHLAPSLHGKYMGKQWKQWQTLFLGDSKIIADGDCSHEVKRHVLLGRKVMTNLESILKSRDITLPTKAQLVKAIFFPVVMYGCESWTIKKAELMLLNCGIGEDSWESLRLQEDPTSPS